MRPAQTSAIDDYYASSLVGAVGPLRMQEAIPFSIAEADEYISLWPITSPLPAFSTK
jgi:hypothetical protein